MVQSDSKIDENWERKLRDKRIWERREVGRDGQREKTMYVSRGVFGSFFYTVRSMIININNIKIINIIHIFHIIHIINFIIIQINNIINYYNNSIHNTNIIISNIIVNIICKD